MGDPTIRLHKKPIGLCKKREVYHYRRRVPTDLLTVFNKSEIWRSLYTDSLTSAVRRLYPTAALVEFQFEKARADLGRSYDPLLVEIANPARSKSRASFTSSAFETISKNDKTMETLRSPSISDVYDLYINDPKHNWSMRTVIAHRTTKRWVEEAFGKRTPISLITRQGCREFLELLQAMPRHADKRFPNMSIREVVKAAKLCGEVRFINTANLNAYINRFRGILNWAINEGYIDRNPVKGLRLHDPVRRSDKRNPFSPQQLRRIFFAPLYTGCVDDERGYSTIGIQRPRRARFWIPLIALFSGLRLNEICQLECTDVINVDGIDCFKVMSGVSAAGHQKRVKTIASERIVPIHSELIRFGFLAFAESQRLLGETSLFPELPLGHLGYRSTCLSKWFSRFLVSADAIAPLTSFHSFRHNFRDGLRAAKIDREVALALGGWTEGTRGSAVADNYGGGYSPIVLADALNEVQYVGLDLSHLKILP